MESSLSCVSSLKEDDVPPYVQPHYRESYRLSIYALLCGGTEAYEDFLRAEQISHFLSEQEIRFILENAERSVPVGDGEEPQDGTGREGEDRSPSTYFPTESDEEVPDLELGWPEVQLHGADTSISLLFHPPRENTPSIKDVVRKQIQEARQVVAVAMDVFTDVDIFKEIISATLKGVVVYILLDESNYSSFLSMSHRVGVHLQDIKNLRVRLVRGQQYQCQSGMKFHGGLQQKFLLVDCQTVMYGTYSYTWTFEKIHLSMVLVVTGQLVCTYDEEFRRLYARSTVPPVRSKDVRSYVHPLRDHGGVAKLQSPNSSQLSLHQINMRSRVVYGARGDATALTRGLSVQERLHQSHCTDMGNLVRGHSYGGELQKINSMTRLRMGTKDIGPPFVSDRSGSNMLPLNRLSQQHLRHRTRYGADQNLIPFNSETSLHRWKMDTYLNDTETPLDASCDAISPLASPYSSHTGLNEQQMMHNRPRDIKSRMEEIRQKRLSLQEYNRSQESRSMYQSLERPKYTTMLRDVRSSLQESNKTNETNAQTDHVDSVEHKDAEPNNDGFKKEQILSDGQRSASHHDVNADRKTQPQMYDWHEPLSRATSAADFEMNDPSLKLSHLQPGGIIMQHPRAMEALTEIPEEKEGSRVNSSESAFKEGNEEVQQEGKDSVRSGPTPEPQLKDQPGRSHGSGGKVGNSSSSAAPRERKKSTPSEALTIAKIGNSTPGSQQAAEGKAGPTSPTVQRKNSMKKKVYSLLSSEEKKTQRKEEKPLQRRASTRSPTPSGANQPLKADHTPAAAAEQTLKRGGSSSISSSQNSLGVATDTTKNKSPFPRLSPSRSSKKKTAAAAAAQASDHSSASTRTSPDGEGAIFHQREKVYSRYEYFLSTESLSRDKPGRGSGVQTSEKEKSSSLNRHDSGYSHYQTQGGADNKLGRFMQRVGNLIGKNK